MKNTKLLQSFALFIVLFCWVEIAQSQSATPTYAPTALTTPAPTPTADPIDGVGCNGQDNAAVCGGMVNCSGANSAYNQCLAQTNGSQEAKNYCKALAKQNAASCCSNSCVANCGLWPGFPPPYEQCTRACLEVLGY